MSKRNSRQMSLGRKSVFVAALTAATMMTAVPVAIAAGGGGGGGGLPSSPSPRTQIDPAEAFRDGVAALQAEDFKKAEKKFGQVLKVAPKMPEANYYMALAKVGRGKEKSSVRYLKRAIKARPNFVEAREKFALVSISLEKPEEAERQLAALVDIQNTCTDNTCDAPFVDRLGVAIARVQGALGQTPADTSDVEGAEGDAEVDPVSLAPVTQDEFASLFLAPREEGVSFYLDAVKLINQDRYEEAISNLTKAQSIVGPHADISNYLGYSHRKIGRFDEAQLYYATALSIDPFHLGATEYLGELYLEIGEVEKAKAQLAKLDELCIFGCAEREDLARLISIREADRYAAQ